MLSVTLTCPQLSLHGIRVALPVAHRQKRWWGASWTGPIGKLFEATGGLQRRHRVLCPWQPFFKRHQAHAAGAVEKSSMYKSVSPGALQGQKHRICPNNLENVAGPLQLVQVSPRERPRTGQPGAAIGDAKSTKCPVQRSEVTRIAVVCFGGREMSAPGCAQASD